MIYLARGCHGICALPGKACTSCGHLCDAVDCRGCQDCCDELGASCNGLISKPLGLYVVLAVLLSAAEVCFCVCALCSEALDACQLKKGLARSVGVEYWLYGQLGAAWLNLVFAPYIRYRLCQNLEHARQQEAGGVQATAVVSRAKVKAAFSDVFWNDIGVCIYVFALIGSFVWSYLGNDWVSASTACDPQGYSSYAAQFGLGFCVFVVIYFVFFNCYLGFMSSLEVTPARYLLPAAAAAAAVHGGRTAMQPPPQQPLRAAPAGMMQGFLGQKPQVTVPAGPFAIPPPSAPPMLPPQPRRTPLQRACRPSQLAKLFACIVLDIFGDATYFAPGLGEGVDVAYAPSQAIALKMLFQSNGIAAFGFVEEILPFTDICPTATIAWLLEVCAPDTGFTRAIGLRSEYNT